MDEKISADLGTGLGEESHRINMDRLTPAIDLLSGIAGGTASVYVGQSLDTVKVKMQTFPSLYNNAWDCFRQTLLKEGLVRGLYAGTVPSLAAQVSENAVLFMCYGMCQKTVAHVVGKSDVKNLSPLENAMSGAGAALFCSLVLCPTELIKCKLQAMSQTQGNIAQKIGPWSLTKEVIRTEGIQGMFRGLVPTLVREIPGYFFFFGGYELSRHMLTPPGKTKDHIGPLATMFSGGMGGVAFWLTIFPADVIKSRTQVQTGQAETPFMRQFMIILRQEGVRALYKGLVPCLLRTFPATGALFLAVESTKRYFTPTPAVEHAILD